MLRARALLWPPRQPSNWCEDYYIKHGVELALPCATAMLCRTTSSPSAPFAVLSKNRNADGCLVQNYFGQEAREPLQRQKARNIDRDAVGDAATVDARGTALQDAAHKIEHQIQLRSRTLTCLRIPSPLAPSLDSDRTRALAACMRKHTGVRSSACRLSNASQRSLVRVASYGKQKRTEW